MKHIHSSMFVGLLLLSACGDTKKEQVITSEKQSVSGRIVDNYLSNALVCVDLNSDADCQADEPHTVSQTDGAFKIPGVLVSDAAQYPLVAKITTDSINQAYNQPVSEAYTLLAPANAAVISPITTLLQNEINEGVNLEVAQHKLITALRTPLTDLYLDNAAEAVNPGLTPEQQMEHARINRFSQISAVLLANSLQKMRLMDDNDQFTTKELIGVILDAQVNHIDQLLVETGFHAEFGHNLLPRIINFSDRTLQAVAIDSTKFAKSLAFKQVKQQATDSTNTRMALVSLDGFHTFQTKKMSDGNKIQTKTFKFDPMQLSAVTSKKQWNGESFELHQPPMEGEYMVATDMGWTLRSGDSALAMPTQENQFPLRIADIPELDMTTSVKEVNISGLNIKRVLKEPSQMLLVESPYMNDWHNMVSNDAVFGDNAKAYVSTLHNDKLSYLLPVSDDCISSDGICNSVITHNQGNEDLISSTNIEQLVSVEPSDGLYERITAVVVGQRGSQQLLAELLDDHAVNFFIKDPHVDLTFIGKSTWSKLNAKNKAFIKVQIPSTLRQFDYSMRKMDHRLLSNFNDKLRIGFEIPARSVLRSNVQSFNTIAKNNIMANLDTNVLSADVMPGLNTMDPVCRNNDTLYTDDNQPIKETLKWPIKYQRDADSCKQTKNLNMTFAEIFQRGVLTSSSSLDRLMLKITRLDENSAMIIFGSAAYSQNLLVSYTFPTENSLVFVKTDTNGDVTLRYSFDLINIEGDIITVKLLTQDFVDGDKGEVNTIMFKVSDKN